MEGHGGVFPGKETTKKTRDSCLKRGQTVTESKDETSFPSSEASSWGCVNFPEGRFHVNRRNTLLKLVNDSWS